MSSIAQTLNKKCVSFYKLLNLCPLGCLLSWKFAIRAPQRVLGLIVISRSSKHLFVPPVSLHLPTFQNPKSPLFFLLRVLNVEIHK